MPGKRPRQRILLYGKETAARSVRGRGGIVPERLAIALMLVSTMVLLIAATNLAGILMARGVSRLGAAGMRIVSSKLVGLPALDVLTLVTVPPLLSAVVLAACLLPARLAARVNPVEALRGL